MFREGQQIGQYTLIGKLGKGGFGEVWLAEKRSQFLSKRVAVKLPHEEQVNFDAIRQEATLWEQASGHPNVLPIIDADVYDGQVVIVSEYADGGSLHDRLKRETKLSTKQAVEMTIGILNGLEFLHSRKIIHRDIKPQNILLQGDTPRLADFGISRAMQTTMISSTIIGTDAYMSPEAFDGKRSIQTDIWSVGVVLYQLLKGSLPFPQEHPTERMFAVLTKDFEPLGNEFPSDLRRIVEKSLAKLPENRFQTCAEMRDELLKAHVPLAHPTLAKTEVFRFPVEPKIIDETPLTIDEKETIANNPPNFVNHPQIYAPAPTQAAFPQESIATSFKPTPFVEAKQQAVQPEMQNFGVTAKKDTSNSFVKIIGSSVVGIFLVVAFSIIFAGKCGSTNNNPLSFQDSSGKYGFKNGAGKVIVQPKYESIGGFFFEGLVSAQLNGKWGYIDESGNEVIPFKYDQTQFFSEGLAAVLLNGKWGYIDKKDNLIIPYRFSQSDYFQNGLVETCINSGAERKCGVIDKTGKDVVDFKYEYIYGFMDGLCAVQKNNKWGFIDKNDVLVIQFKYDSGAYFVNGYAEVIRDGKKLRVDKFGNESDIGAAGNTKNPNVSTYNTPASNANSAR